MLRRIFYGLVDLIYPKTCLACRDKLADQSSNEFICAQCHNKIKKNNPPFCHCCGRQLDKKGFVKNICPACVKKKLYFDRAFSPCVYEGVIKELIHQFKYKNKKYLGNLLAGLLADFIKEYEVPINFIDLVMPIPLSNVKMREREFNQAQVLSDYIGREFNKPVDVNNLTRIHHLQSQTELDDFKRLANVKGCFSLKDNQAVRGKNVLLIDDVLTTGATSSEAALVLKNNQANTVFVLTLAN